MGWAPLEQVGAPVVQQLPGQGEQGNGGLACLGLRLLGHPGLDVRVQVDREAPLGPGGDAGPGLQDIGGVLGGECGPVQGLAPGRQIRFDALGAIGEGPSGPDRVVLQVPAQVIGLDGTEWGDQAPTGQALDLPPERVRGLVEQPGAGAGAALAVLLDEAQVAELQDQLLHRRRCRLGLDGRIGREPSTQGNKDGADRGIEPAGNSGDGDVDGLLVEDRLQHAELGGVEGEGDYRELVPAALLLNCEGMGQLFADPLRLQGGGVDQDGVGTGLVDGRLNRGPKRIAAAQLARVDPDRLAQLGEGLVQQRNNGIIGAGVGQKEVAHGRRGSLCAPCPSG